MSKLKLIIIFLIICAMICLCACSKESENAEYDGPSLTSLVAYDVPEGYIEWNTSAAANDRDIITEIAFAIDEERTTEPNLSLTLEQYEDKKTGTRFYENFENAMEDETVAYTLDVDEERYTGYVIESTYVDDNDKEQKALECLFHCGNAIFSVDYFAAEGDTDYKPFYQLIDSLHIITDKDIPESIDSLFELELPDTYKEDMAFTYDNKENAPVVEKTWTDTASGGYFSESIFSYKGRDCCSSIGASVDFDEYVDALSDAERIGIDGETGFFGTMESDDMPDMVAIVFVRHGDYVFEFRLTNSDEQVTKEQMKMFKSMVKTIKFSE